MAERHKKVRGMHDILPEEISKWQFVENIITETVKHYGYKEIRTPLVEFRSLFERSIGAETDIISKEIYAFQDRKGRDIALRPEGTASVVRAFIDSGISSSRKISRLFYYGPMFRYDRPQKGRYRQFYQFGVELIGGSHPFFDGEVVVMLNAITERLNLKKSSILVNTLGCSKCKERYSALIKDYFSTKDTFSVMIAEEECRHLLCGYWIVKTLPVKKIISEAPVINKILCGECQDILKFENTCKSIMFLIRLTRTW